MPEPQGNAPVEGNKDRTNFSKAGAGAKISASRLDQSGSKGTVKGTPTRARAASPGGKGK